MDMDIDQSRCYHTSGCIDHLLIASVIFHFPDRFDLSAVNDNIQNLVCIALCVYYTPVFNQNHLSSSCFICFYVSYL